MKDPEKASYSDKTFDFQLCNFVGKGKTVIFEK